MTWRVKFFQSARGDYPVKDFITVYDMATQAKIALSIRLLINRDPFLNPPYIKKLAEALNSHLEIKFTSSS